jgi:hypothetical protein
MKTPAGKECRFYYEDYYRGRSNQECRLVKGSSRSLDWRPRDCSDCPVPDILQANGSPYLVLHGRIRSGFLGFNRRMEVSAFCSKHSVEIDEPHIGCPQCALERPGWQELFGKDDQVG